MAKTALKKGGKPTKGEIAAQARIRARVEALKAAAEAKARTSSDGTKFTKKETVAIKARDELIEQYMPYAASIASRVCQSLSAAVDYDEVLCNARLGLLEAAKRFDDNQEVDFRTFAYYRIKGAIYDGLRRSGWLPRTLYAKIKFEEAANEFLQNRSLGNASENASQRNTHEKVEENSVAETVNSLASIYIISLDANEDMEVEDQDSGNVEQRTEFMQVRRHMRDAISTLPEKEKLLIMMYYFQNRTLEEVGEKIGLSKSWTSRLHARALSLLFKRIRNRATSTPDGEGEEE
ncbi:MAG: sigma-70 family RNA polymerase sigma factor [Proteobacteria bacterium]|nr:sigma-70 family RNA polymerase sigma factor [Pseudomonadota bacterium]